MNGPARAAAQETERLRARIDTLEEELRQARTALVPNTFFPMRWKLTRQQQAILSFLLVRAPMPRPPALILDALRLAGYDCQLRTIDVVICVIRKKIKNEGFIIHSRNGVGYFLDATAARRMSDLCAREARGEDTTPDQAVVIVGGVRPAREDLIELAGVAGNPEQLRQLVREMHALGRKFWPDMVENDFDAYLREVLS